LCACILSIFNDEDSSTILSYLCMRLLPPGTACASMSQLYDVATILSSKLDALGFGTFLAEQTIRVCKVYEQLDMRVPNGLLESFSLDSAVDILYSISRAVREPDVLVRISGTSGMGYIIAFIMTLFPEDCLIIVEGVIINSGVRQVIVIELNATANQECPTQISIEKILERKENISLPIETNSNKMLWGKFQWPGYLASPGFLGCYLRLVIFASLLDGRQLFNCEWRPTACRRSYCTSRCGSLAQNNTSMGRDARCFTYPTTQESKSCLV
jgi:hypothetical protein